MGTQMIGQVIQQIVEPAVGAHRREAPPACQPSGGVMRISPALPRRACVPRQIERGVNQSDV